MVVIMRYMCEMYYYIFNKNQHICRRSQNICYICIKILMPWGLKGVKSLSDARWEARAVAI